MDAQAIEREIRDWLERIVIGLNLCPFAKSVYVKHQVRIRISEATEIDDLLAELGEALLDLRDTPAETVDTTLLVHPNVLGDFLDYNDFLGEADALVEALDLEGVIQVASFHPDYQFADTTPGDPSNLTNRAPYPILHLLREDSVARAVAAYPDPEAIIERNIRTVCELGFSGYARRLQGISDD